MKALTRLSPRARLSGRTTYNRGYTLHIVELLETQEDKEGGNSAWWLTLVSKTLVYRQPGTWNHIHNVPPLPTLSLSIGPKLLILFSVDIWTDSKTDRPLQFYLASNPRLLPISVPKRPILCPTNTVSYNLDNILS